MAERRGSKVRWGMVGVVALVAAACGSRLSSDEIAARSTVPSTGPTTATTAAPSGVAGGGAVVAPNGPAAAGTAPAAAGQPVAASPSRAATAAPPAVKAPIVVGFIGAMSGIGSDILSPARDAFVAWQRMVNARGGINGHPVQLLVGDDGGNASRSISVARDFVENKGAVVLSYVGTGLPFADYARSRSVPVVGTSMTGDHWNDNPMLFPPMGAGDSSSWATARMMKLAGVTKVGIISCAEAQDCKTGQSRVARAAEAEGLQVVYQGQYSVTQPDFTAECIQMHRSGAEAIYPPGDTASGIRMAKSCARQAYRPIWVTPTPATSLASIPEYEGGIGISPVFPWFLRSGSPAIVEYAQALQQYAPKQAADGVGFLSWSWVSAKLIEKAAQHVSDKPTSQDILNGLWSMRGETLGGLLPGRAARTFIRNQPTPETFCTYRARIQGGRWVAPDGLNPTCR